MTQTEIINLLPAFLRNSSTYSLIVTDLEGKYIYVNDLFKKRFSFLDSDFIGKSISFALHPGDLEQCDTVAMQCFRNPDAVFPLQIRKPSNNEDEFHWTHWEFSLFKDEQGNPAGILCVGHDITAAQVMNQQLRHSENKLRAILESTSDSNILISTDYKILSFNKQADKGAVAAFGKPLVIGASMDEFILPLDREDFYADTRRVLQGEFMHFEREIFIDNTSSWIEVFYVPAYGDNGELIGFTFSCNDITERKKGEQRILQQDERLKQIIWQQSHEVRRHIVNIMGLYNIIKLDQNISAEEKIQHLDDLLKEVKELDYIIHSIVSSSLG